jgi:cell division protease FtsH
MFGRLRASLAKAFPVGDKLVLVTRAGALTVLVGAVLMGIALHYTAAPHRARTGTLPFETPPATVAAGSPTLTGAAIAWATPAQQAAFRTERAHGVPFSFSDLLAAIGDRAVVIATLSPNHGQARVTLRGGAQVLVYYPPADEARLTSMLTRSGASVNVDPSDLVPGKPVLEEISGPLIAIILVGGTFLLMFVASRRGWLGLADRSARPGTSQSMTPVGNRPPIRFADVAGCDEAVDELAEVVDSLRSPERYAATGAVIPAGVILYGPPGTGKTLLARAVAGEAEKPFYATSGSQFVEMYAGVGARRIRDLFSAARRTGGVVFIDELDAVGRARASSATPSNDEREATLNQLLVELDGFHRREGVVVIAATNRLDVLDPALLRPGRFSRHIAVTPPAQDGRLAILRLHARGKPLGDDVDLEALALSTAGATGADLADMVNEGAIMAARDRATVIRHHHLWEGFLRAVAGPRKKSSMLAHGEREVIAYHEAGHVLCAELCPTCDPTLHATINPRGNAKGFAVTGASDRALSDEQHVHEQLMHVLGGRGAEFVYRGTISSGAADDLDKANRIARRAVQEWGLTAEVGQLISGPQGLSEEMRGRADREVRRLVDDAYRDAVALIDEHRAQLDRLAAALLKAGDIDRPEIVAALEGAVAQARTIRGAYAGHDQRSSS